MAVESSVLSGIQTAFRPVPMIAERALRAGILYALSLIRSRYEGNADPEQDMAFHCVEHTVGVIRRTAALLGAMRARPEDVAPGLLGAAFHDTVQNWEPSTTPDGRVLRRRSTGQNEIDSAAEGVSWMRASGAFQERDYELVTQAIRATVPGWDPQNGTVSHPNLDADAPPPVRAVAMADLAIDGMEGAAFVAAGDQLFREENLDISRAIRSCKTRGDLPKATLEAYRTRMLNWCRSQVGFTRGRRARLDLELGNLDPDTKERVRALFTGFEVAINGSEEVARLRETLPPWEVARAMGYSVPA